MKKFWSKCNGDVAECVLKNVEAEIENDQNVHELDVYIQIAKTTVEEIEFESLPEELEQTVSLLHQTLSSLNKRHEALMEKISRLCESWYSRNFPNKKEYIVNALKYLIQKVISRGTVRSKYSFVKNVCIFIQTN